MLHKHRRARTAASRWRRGIGVGVLAVLLGGTAWLVLPAAATPGNDSLGARIAERARDNGFGFVVTAAESLQYQLNPPKVGGAPDAAGEQSMAAAAHAAASAAAQARQVAGARAAAVPAAVLPPIVPFASPALPGEGQWAVRVTVQGQPAVETALLRPDAMHTSYLAGVAWMSGSLLRFVQHPGVTDPGHLSQWSQPADIPPDQRAGLAATFNSGFKISDSRGAFYADGHTVGTFRTGAASLVIYADGHLDIGAWGSEVGMTPQVTSVRQNLDLLVDNGQISPQINSNAQVAWGATIGAKDYVWRSGIGVTAQGDAVFVTGNALSAASLAALLQRAGAVRAMELDINPSWVSYMWYSPSAGSASPEPHKLVDFSRPADRYYTVNNRDFFAVYAR